MTDRARRATGPAPRRSAVRASHVVLLVVAVVVIGLVLAGARRPPRVTTRFERGDAFCMATRVVTVDRRTWFAPVGDAGTPDPGTVVGDFVVEDERTASLRAEGLTITFTPFRPCV